MDFSRFLLAVLALASAPALLDCGTDSGSSGRTGGTSGTGAVGGIGGSGAGGAGAGGASGGAGASSDGGADAGAACPVTYYVAPNGSDAADGSTPTEAALTIGRVHELVTAVDPPCDVEVRISQGNYLGQSVEWSWHRPGVAVKLMPIDYQGGGIESIAGRPVFDGQGAPFFFRVDLASGQASNVQLIYLQMQAYRQFAIHFRGDRDDFATGWNGGNRIFGCVIQDIGNLSNAGDVGYGGIDLVNSRENEIRNNHFLRLENGSGSGGLMHGVYLAHGSRANQITSNRFETISGDPIRVRDDSSSNVITDNRFADTGIAAFYSDWWCDMSANPDCTKPSGECPSWENEFRDNELHCGYAATALPTFAYLQGATTVPSWCTNHFEESWVRLHTSGNSNACP